jgi:branched-chain amino acid transport system substrate-binding protein
MRTRWFSALAALSLAALAACDSAPRDAAAPAPGTPAPPSDTILIGEYGSLTGSEATFGQSTDNGIQLAVEEINKAGGVKDKKLVVKVYDDQGKTQEAGNAVMRLITQDKAVAILGEVASSLSLAGGRVAQQNNVPMISPSSTNVTVTEIGDMIFRVCFTDDFQAYAVATFASETLKAKKVAVLYDQGSAYSKGLKDEFGKTFSGSGGSVATEQAYKAGDADFSAQLTAIRDTKPDAIFIPGYYTDVANIAVQAKKLGISAPLLGGDGWDSAELPKIAGAAVEGAYYSNHYAVEEPRAEVQAFVTAYSAKFGTAPDGLAAMGYDAAKILADAMKRAPDLSGGALAKAIGETKDYAGVTGRISIDGKRNASKPAVIVQMKGGKPTFVTQVYPAGVTPPAAVTTDAAAPAAGSAPADAATPPAPAK